MGIRAKVAGAMPVCWVLGYTGLYMVLLTVLMIGLAGNLRDGLFTMLWLGPYAIVALPVLIGLLALTRMLMDVRWQAFRLGAVLIIGLPSLLTIGADPWWFFPAAHLALALLLVQPQPFPEDGRRKAATAGPGR